MTAISVDELSELVKQAIEGNPSMAQVAVHGEIIDFKRHGSGHVFFTLGGTKSRISCVMFKWGTRSSLFSPSPGDEVMVGGKVTAYPERGMYQLYARRILPLGKGAIGRAREEIKAKLALEGLFDQDRKRPIPAFPRRIACITSPTGAAVKDVIKVAGTRNPGVSIVIIPALVQGIDAPDQIVRAFSALSMIPEVDTVLLVRGGGSKDDLTAFDDPDVVRAVAYCPVPVVVGVGHQVDFTLADQAADCRCATPSEAAQRAVPSLGELELQIESLKKDLLSPAVMSLKEAERDLLSFKKDLHRKASDCVAVNASALSALKQVMILKLKYRLSQEFSRFSELTYAIKAMSPRSVLKRGFSFLRDSSGMPVSSVASLSPGDRVFFNLLDGEVLCEVKKVTPKYKEGLN